MISSSFSEYKEAIGILANTSKHPSLIAKTIKDKIIPKLSHHPRKLLDVGAGAGGITALLHEEFEEAVAIEVNTEFVGAYDNTKVKLYNCDFMNIELEEKFDLVICSHVMYHFTKDEMS